LSNRRRKNEEVKRIKKDLVNYAYSTWGQEWIHSILESGRPYRMQRGIEYAKDKRRIDNISINKGQIFATVQGTAPTPYRVKINFKIIPEEGWKKIIKELSTKTINLIELLNGVLPSEIITIFEENKFPLFLTEELNKENASCSCPDPAIPCKHIAATILYTARVLDYNPFILTTLRGKTKIDLLNDLNIAKENRDVKLEKEAPQIDNKVKHSFNVPKIDKEDLIISPQYSKEYKEMTFHFKKSGEILETLDNLGKPPNLEDPLAFEMVFEGIYKTISSEIYKRAMDIK